MRIVEGQRGGIESRGGRERPSPSTRRRRGGAGLGGGGGNRWSGGGGGAGDGTECFGWVGWLPPAVSTEQEEPLLTECSSWPGLEGSRVDGGVRARRADG
jgi:hypothetical protein